MVGKGIIYQKETSENEQFQVCIKKTIIPCETRTNTDYQICTR